MLTVFLGIGLMMVFAALMSLGLMIKGKPIEGTCASQSKLLSEDGTCMACGKEVGSCENDLPEINKMTAKS